MYLNRLIPAVLLLITILSLSAQPVKAQTIDSLYTIPPDISACTPGVLSDSEKQAVVETINSVRALHQLAPVVYDANYDDEVAQASLLIVANQYTTHYPSSSAKCFSQSGYDGSSSSNLLWVEPSTFDDTPLLQPSTADINTWLIDKDVENLRHRRWLLDPFLHKIAYGRVDGSPLGYDQNQWGRGAALKVYFKEEKPWTVPSPDFIAYPFGDYPLALFAVDWYWSFSVIVDPNRRENNAAVDYSKAVIEVYNSDGNLTVQEVAYNTENVAIANFLQWKVPDAEVEQAYQVRIRNVRVQGKLRDYEYTVKLTQPYYTIGDIPIYENPKHGEVIKVKSGESFAIFAKPPRILLPTYQTGSDTLHLQTFVASPYVTVFQIDGVVGDELIISFEKWDYAVIRVIAEVKSNFAANEDQPTNLQAQRVVSVTGEINLNDTGILTRTVELPSPPPVPKPKVCTTLPTLTNTKLARLVVPYAGTTPQIFVVDTHAPYLDLLDDTSSTDSFPTWSPDGSKIAFLSHERLFVMDADGKNRRQLAELPVGAFQPSWSPDSNWIAFSATPPKQDKLPRFAGFATEIYLVQPDGNNLRRLTADERWDSNPVWSPTGKAIAFTSNTVPPMAGGRDKPSTDLLIMNLVDGAKITIHAPNRDISNPLWSPSGTQLAFITKPLVIPGDADGAAKNEHLHLISADGTSTRQLSPDDWRVALPTWSPDEQWLAFSVLPDLFDRSQNTTSAYLLRADGACGAPLVSPAIQTINAVVWSPYDSQIAIISQPPAVDTAPAHVIEPSTLTTTIALVDAHTLQTTILIEQAAKMNEYEHVGIPTWAPLCALQNTDCNLSTSLTIDELYQVSAEEVTALAQKQPVLPQPRRPASAGGPSSAPQANTQPLEEEVEAPALPLAFCLDANFDTAASVCTTSQTLFTGVVKLIRVSWAPTPEFPNALYKRVWYFNGTRFLEREDTKTTAHIEVGTKESLSPGQYRFELYVGEQLVQSAEFEIR